MTDEPNSEEQSSGAPESASLSFQVPDVEDVEVYLIRLDDGRVVARTAEEIEEEGGSILE